MGDDTVSTLRPFVRPLVKAGLALLGLVVVRLFVTILPGLDIPVSSTGLTVAQVVSVVLGLAIVALVVWVGLRVHEVGRQSTDAVVASLSRGGRLVVALVAVVLLHDVLQPIAAALLTPQPGVWPYDLGFLLLALVPLGLLAYRMATNLDDVTDVVVDAVDARAGAQHGAGAGSGAGGSAASSASGGGSSGSDGAGAQPTCADCGASIPGDSGFCPSCGARLAASN